MGYCDWYILKGHEPVRTTDLVALNEWMEDVEKRRVALTKGEGWEVSTVFLGIDQWMGSPGTEDNHTPILFETMVFPTEDSWERLGRRLRDWRERCATWEQAEAGHERMVQWLKNWLATPKPRVKRTVRVRKEKA